MVAGASPVESPSASSAHRLRVQHASSITPMLGYGLPPLAQMLHSGGVLGVLPLHGANTISSGHHCHHQQLLTTSLLQGHRTTLSHQWVQQVLAWPTNLRWPITTHHLTSRQATQWTNQSKKKIHSSMLYLFPQYQVIKMNPFYLCMSHNYWKNESGLVNTLIWHIL